MGVPQDALRYVLFPEFNGVFYPSCGIRTDAESETMTYIPILVILDFYSSVSHGIYTPVNSGYINDSVIFALNHKRRRVILGEGRMTGICHDYNARSRKIIITISGRAV